MVEAPARPPRPQTPLLPRRLPAPRLLPLTIFGIASLLTLKLVDVTIAVLPDGSRRPVEAVRSHLFAVVAHAATPEETKPAEAKPAEAKPGETKPVDAKTGEMKVGETKGGEIKLAEAKPAEAPAGAKAMPDPAAVAPGATEGSAARPIGEVAAQMGPGASESERALLVDLRARRKELDEREAALTARSNLLQAAEVRLNARLDEMKVLQAKLEALEKAREAQTDANTHGLVKVYENMKPRDAATIWNDLDIDVLLPLLDLMKESKASALLAAMDPVRAREVTTRLAKRRALATMVSAAPVAAASTSGTAGSTPGPNAAGGAARPASPAAGATNGSASGPVGGPVGGG
jgi:flagellar motility protein MotE (MotC chaperone)